jgi:hypothetical protein
VDDGSSAHARQAAAQANYFWPPAGRGEKTTITRELARQIGAVHLRVESIEQSIRASGYTKLTSQPIDDAGYRVAYAVPEHNLRIGRTVIADSVNLLHLTRDAWGAIANTMQPVSSKSMSHALMPTNIDAGWKRESLTSPD